MNVPMDFELKLEPNGSFAILTNRKDVTLQSAIEHQRAMRKFAETHGVNHFLIDTRGMIFGGTYVDLFRFVRKILHKEGFDSTWKVALVTSPKDRSHDMLEVFTHNAGYQSRSLRITMKRKCGLRGIPTCEYCYSSRAKGRKPFYPDMVMLNKFGQRHCAPAL